MREATKKQLDLQEVLFSRMVVRTEFVLQKQLQQALQAAAGNLEKANITVEEATALLDYDKSELMPSNSLLYKVDKYDKVGLPALLICCACWACDPCLLLVLEAGIAAAAVAAAAAVDLILFCCFLYCSCAEFPASVCKIVR